MSPSVYIHRVPSRQEDRGSGGQYPTTATKTSESKVQNLHGNATHYAHVHVAVMDDTTIGGLLSIVLLLLAVLLVFVGSSALISCTALVGLVRCHFPTIFIIITQLLWRRRRWRRCSSLLLALAMQVTLPAVLLLVHLLQSKSFFLPWNNGIGGVTKGLKFKRAQGGGEEVTL